MSSLSMSLVTIMARSSSSVASMTSARSSSVTASVVAPRTPRTTVAFALGMLRIWRWGLVRAR